MRDKPSVIPAGIVIAGEIEGDADLVVHGRVEGPIRVGGTLVIEEGAIVRGHVYALSVTVRGALKGNAFGEEAVRVDAGAKLVGDLTAPRVNVVPGARFRGQVHVARVGEPALRSYDPALHTFSGAPVPTAVGFDAPMISDAGPDMELEERMTIPVPRSAEPGPLSSDAVTIEAALIPSGEQLDSQPPPPRRRRRSAPRALPRLGKTKGRRQTGAR